MHVDLLFTPLELQEIYLQNRAIVIIDALRATSTMSVALQNGADKIITKAGIEESIATQKELGANALLCGERGGLIIPGFDLGNSPFEYTNQTISGKTLIFCTTNGTKAIAMTQQADMVFLGATVNGQATAKKLAACGKDITILCAGTENKVSLEDTLSGGLILTELCAIAPHCQYNDAALIAMQAYHKNAEELPQLFLQGKHAQKLIHLKHEKDVLFCAQKNTVQTVPHLCADGFFHC